MSVLEKFENNLNNWRTKSDWNRLVSVEFDAIFNFLNWNRLKSFIFNWLANLFFSSAYKQTYFDWLLQWNGIKFIKCVKRKYHPENESRKVFQMMECNGFVLVSHWQFDCGRTICTPFFLLQLSVSFHISVYISRDRMMYYQRTCLILKAKLKILIV